MVRRLTPRAWARSLSVATAPLRLGFGHQAQQDVAAALGAVGGEGVILGLGEGPGDIDVIVRGEFTAEWHIAPYQGDGFGLAEAGHGRFYLPVEGNAGKIGAGRGSGFRPFRV
jgi:hypothetical protein